MANILMVSTNAANYRLILRNENMFGYVYTLRRKASIKNLKRFHQRYLFRTSKRFYTGSIWDLLGSFIIICFVHSR